MTTDLIWGVICDNTLYIYRLWLMASRVPLVASSSHLRKPDATVLGTRRPLPRRRRTEFYEVRTAVGGTENR